MLKWAVMIYYYLVHFLGVFLMCWYIVPKYVPKGMRYIESVLS